MLPHKVRLSPSFALEGWSPQVRAISVVIALVRIEWSLIACTVRRTQSRSIAKIVIYRYRAQSLASICRCIHRVAMNVSLTPELERLILLKVKTGRYSSSSEVIREAPRLMDERDQLQALHKDEIRHRIASGMASLSAGGGSDGDAVFENMDTELAELERLASA